MGLACPAPQLNRPDVQTVVLQALLEDPNVQDLIHDRNLVRRTQTLLLETQKAEH